jgi:hypothetical protein
MTNELFALFFLDRLSGPQRRSVFNQILPSMIPGPSSQRLVFATITAEQQVKRAALEDRNVIEEVVKETEVQDAVELQARFPKLHARFTALTPELQAQIFPRPPEPGAEDGAAKGDKGAQPPDYGTKAPQPTQAH